MDKMTKGIPDPIKLPDKTRCVKCGASEAPNKALRRCGKCRAAPYCSVECQKADWKDHKPLCVRYALDKNLNYKAAYVNEGAKGGKKRTRGDILRDLADFANSHNGDTLTISAWNLLGLTKDISRAKTHFLTLTLHRTESSNPRTMYTLAQAEVIPLTVSDSIYANRGSFVDNSPMSPRMILEHDAERRIREHGALGSVMVICIEVAKTETRPPREVLADLVVVNFQPLGLFKETRKSLAPFAAASLPQKFFIQCLENGLKGGAYSPTFVPYYG